MAQTTRDIEAATARLLGAAPDEADAAVAALAAHGLLADGVLLHAVLAAARRGSGLPEALIALAALEAAPSTWSAYEARTAAEEAAEEAQAALARLQPEAGRVAEVANLRAAADALCAGAGVLQLTAVLPEVEAAWLSALCALVDVTLIGVTVEQPHSSGAARAQTVVDASPSALDLVMLAKKSA